MNINAFVRSQNDRIARLEPPRDIERLAAEDAHESREIEPSIRIDETERKQRASRIRPSRLAKVLRRQRVIWLERQGLLKRVQRTFIGTDFDERRA